MRYDDMWQRLKELILDMKYLEGKDCLDLDLLIKTMFEIEINENKIQQGFVAKMKELEIRDKELKVKATER